MVGVGECFSYVPVAMDPFNIIKHADNRCFIAQFPNLVQMCERAMTDPEPQLRAAAMTLTWHLAEHLPNAFLGDARKGSRSVR